MPSTKSAHPSVIVLLGPTASGKSALAFDLATNINAEIISADSRQIYRELNIGVAKPSPEMLEKVTHHFINEKNIGEPFTAGDFASGAVLRINDIHRRGKRVVIAGGSTLYLEGLLHGFAELPPANPDIRAKLLNELKHYGSAQLYERLRQQDPEQAKTLDQTKSQRLIRSLEIIEITGKSVTELQACGKEESADMSFHTFGLSIPREQLYQRINQRVDVMMNTGLYLEAEQLYQRYRQISGDKQISALQTVGYQELFQHFAGNIDLAEAVTLIKQHTRNYAKRQLTFFNNRLTVQWLQAPVNNCALDSITAILTKPLIG